MNAQRLTALAQQLNAELARVDGLEAAKADAIAAGDVAQVREVISSEDELCKRIEALCSRINSEGAEDADGAE